MLLLPCLSPTLCHEIQNEGINSASSGCQVHGLQCRGHMKEQQHQVWRKEMAWNPVFYRLQAEALGMVHLVYLVILPLNAIVCG